MRRLRRRFKRPKSPFDVQQLADGKELQKKYGLRRKKEIWIAQEIVRGFRQRARQLTAESNPAEENILLKKIEKLGLLPEGGKLDDVSGLTVENLLERRLQTLVEKRGFAKTVNQARQTIVHGQVRIRERKIIFPSYLVTVEEESSIVSSFTPPKPVKQQVTKSKGEKPEEKQKTSVRR